MNGAVGVIFIGVALTLVTLVLALSGGAAGRMRKRAEGVKKRAKGGGRPTSVLAPGAASVKRSQGRSVPVVEDLAKRFLPRQTVLRDRLSRTGHAISIGTMCVPYENTAQAVSVAALVPGEGDESEIDIDGIDDLAVASGSPAGQDAVANTATPIEAPVATASSQPEWRAPLPAAVEDDPVWRYMMARVQGGADPSPAAPYSAGPLASIDSGSAGKVSP